VSAGGVFSIIVGGMCEERGEERKGVSEVRAEKS